MPQYCVMSIDCWCKQTHSCFSDIFNAAPATTILYAHMYSVSEAGGGRTSNRPWSDAVHAWIVGSSLTEILLTSFFHIHLLFSLRHLYRDRLRKGRSGHWWISKAAIGTPLVPEIIFSKRSSRALHTVIWDGNCSFLYLSTRFATRFDTACFARLRNSHNKACLSCAGKTNN